jgi:hypothetical protein
MSDIEKQDAEDTEEIWVNASEATEITGYNYHSVLKLIFKISKQPEEDREVRMRKRSTGWEMWLPDLLNYIYKPGAGPQTKRKHKNLDT